MFAVIFEVEPKQERFDDYLDLAKQLKPKLEAIDGFIDNERFKSHVVEGRILSLSTWRDEKAVVRWRAQGEHHAVQEKGRSAIFNNYHLRVGEIIADSVPPKGLQIEEARFDATEVGKAKLCTITEVSPPRGARSGARPEFLLSHLQLEPRLDGLLEHDLFESIYNPGKVLVLASWRDKVAADGWKPAAFEGAGDIRHRQVRVIRDYGMFERREAPQFFPEVERTDGH